MAEYFVEQFSNIFDFVSAIKSRPDTGHADNSAKENSESFSGMPLDKAYECVHTGLPEVSSELKRELVKFTTSNVGYLPKHMPSNYYYGHAPNVPAAIIGLPKAMRRITNVPQKVKTIKFFYNNVANSSTKKEILEKAGACVLKLVQLAEVNGYRVEFDLIDYLAVKDSYNAICTINLKQYGQPLDILKLSFPLTSVSMFRRLGFRWLETMPTLKGDWSFSYGRSIDHKDDAMSKLSEAGVDLRNAYYISVPMCKDANFDPYKLAKQLEINL